MHNTKIRSKSEESSILRNVLPDEYVLLWSIHFSVFLLLSFFLLTGIKYARLVPDPVSFGFE